MIKNKGSGNVLDFRKLKEHENPTLGLVLEWKKGQKEFIGSGDRTETDRLKSSIQITMVT